MRSVGGWVIRMRAFDESLPVYLLNYFEVLGFELSGIFVFFENELSYSYYECIIPFILSRDLKLIWSPGYINDPVNSFFIRLNLITFRNESFWITMNLRAKRIFKWIKLEVYKIIIWNGQNESKGEQQTWLQRVVISNESKKIWSELVLESSSTLELPKWIKT